ncbi:MAG: hypothetical protein HQL73_03660 [Magnetococcales bacterium]|nr:hypothetical protein [Magnetococcales bacterium]
MRRPKSLNNSTWMVASLLAAGIGMAATANAYDRDAGVVWTACVFNRDHRDREVSATWYGDRGRNDRCATSSIIRAGGVYPFSCRFLRSHPSVKIEILGRDGGVRVEGQINVAPGGGSHHRCDRNNSSTITRVGHELVLQSGIPREERRHGRDGSAY